jgi:predicted Zn-dependent peptidase
MNRRLTTVVALGLCALAPSLLPAALASAMTEARLENGLRFFYEERPASGLVASAVLVQAGAEHETPALNGAAHFLEHLLFNGTESRTQEQLYRDFDLIGAYSNATTRRDHVAYLVVAGGEDLEQALALQADMLFHSTLPPEQFDKERGIILEEIAKDASASGSEAEQVLAELLAGGREELPVLGTPASIAALDREQVLDYYRRYYVPGNMTLIVLGDFVPAVLRAAVERSFGARVVSGDETIGGAPDALRPPAVPTLLPPPAMPSGIFQRPVAGDQIQVRLRILAGRPVDVSLPALLLVVELLNGESNGLATALQAEPPIPGAEAAAALQVEAGRVWLEIGARCDSTAQVEAVQARLVRALRAVAGGVPAEALAAARTRREVAAALAADEIHYVAFTRADWILHAPLAAWADEAGAIAATDGAAVMAAASSLLDRSAMLAAVGPGLPVVSENRHPLELRAQESRPSVADSAPRSAPPGAAAEEASDRPAEAREEADWPRAPAARPPVRRTLPNGLTAVVAGSPESDVFAIELLARGRTFCEPSGKSGLADLLHRVLPYGAGGRSREELGRELDLAGIRLKLTDDPRIPYDDYQTTQTCSFIRLETVDRFGREALALLAAMVQEPELSPDAVAEVQRQAVLEAERRAASPSEQSQLLLRQELFGHSPGARPALGTASDLQSITSDDLRDFHRHYFAPSNLILAVVTGIEPQAVLARIEAVWGGVADGGRKGDGGRNADGGRNSEMESATERSGDCADRAAMRPEVTRVAGRREILLGREQSWIRLGTALDTAAADRAALEVATLLLSERMSFELRERQGLAYSVGAALGTAGDRAWLAVGMGTRPENLARAETGLTAEIRRLGDEAMAAADVTRVVKAQQGRQRMRRVTRINQAQALAYEALAGDPPGTSAAELSALAAVAPEDVARVARTVFAQAPLLTVIAR